MEHESDVPGSLNIAYLFHDYPFGAAFFASSFSILKTYQVR